MRRVANDRQRRNGFIIVTLTALWSPTWGMSMVSAEMGGG